MNDIKNLIEVKGLFLLKLSDDQSSHRQGKPLIFIDLGFNFLYKKPKAMLS